jgi:hypothetical protein
MRVVNGKVRESNNKVISCGGGRLSGRRIARVNREERGGKEEVKGCCKGYTELER